MGWSIICDSRYGRRKGITTLALVDRKKTKKYWWTDSDINIIINYRCKIAATFVAKRLKKNNARVVSYTQAVRILEDQENLIMEDEANLEAEMGWDAYKS